MYIQLFSSILELLKVNIVHSNLKLISYFSMIRWEKELDWMAMNGINLVYATTANEYIFSKVRITFLKQEKSYHTLYYVFL